MKIKNAFKSLTTLFLTALFVFSTSHVFAGTTWPENITPNDVQRNIDHLNEMADQLLEHKHLKIPAPITLSIPRNLGVDATVQLHLSAIELMHDFELKVNLRPMPIITSSPIEYYPADIFYLSNLLIEQMKKIMRTEHVSPRLPLEHHVPEQNSYDGMLDFYVKLAALDGVAELSSNEIFSQFNRINSEMQDIVVHLLPTIKDMRNRRVLASSTFGINTYGGSISSNNGKKTMVDIYNKCLAISDDLEAIITKRPVVHTHPPVAKDFVVTPFALFVQSQTIMAQLNQWKRELKIPTSTPINLVAQNKTYSDTYQLTATTEYMINTLQTVLASH